MNRVSYIFLDSMTSSTFGSNTDYAIHLLAKKVKEQLTLPKINK